MRYIFILILLYPLNNIDRCIDMGIESFTVKFAIIKWFLDISHVLFYSYTEII